MPTSSAQNGYWRLTVGTQLLLLSSRAVKRVRRESLRLGRDCPDLEVLDFLTRRVPALGLHRDRLAVRLVYDQRHGVDTGLRAGLVGVRDAEVAVVVHLQSDAVVTQDGPGAGGCRAEAGRTLRELAREGDGAGAVHRHVVHQGGGGLRRRGCRRRWRVATRELSLQVRPNRRRGIGRSVHVSGLLADDLDGVAVCLDGGLTLDEDRVVGLALGEEVVVQRHDAVALADGGRTTDVNACFHVALVLPPVAVAVAVLVLTLVVLDDRGLLVPAVAVVDHTVTVEVLAPANRNQGVGGLAAAARGGLGHLEQHRLVALDGVAHATHLVGDVLDGVRELGPGTEPEAAGRHHVGRPPLDEPVGHGRLAEHHLGLRALLELEGGRVGVEPLDHLLARVGLQGRALLGVRHAPVSRGLVDRVEDRQPIGVGG